MVEIARDPVCGMDVDAENALSLVHKTVAYFFCSPSCLKRFEEDPGAFIT